MKPAISADRVAYPDVSYQLNDIVSQQPAPAQVEGVKVKRLAADDSRAVQATRMGAFEKLMSRGENSVASFGHMPRPAGWSNAPGVFHEFSTKEQLRSAGVALKLNKKLDEILNQVSGQINDPKFTADNVTALLPRDFKGLHFKPEGNQDSMQFIQSRSLHSVDELRSRAATRQQTGVQEVADRANALLQLRAKLHQLGRLGNFIERSFSNLEAIDLGRLKTPQLC